MLLATLVGAGAIVSVWSTVFTNDTPGATPSGELPPTVAVMEEERREAPPGFKEYRNAQYRFSILVPEDLAVAHVPGEEGSATFVFQDETGTKGFQIFIAQYLEQQVSEERFRTDNPSGVRENMQDITIDGAVGASFTGAHPTLGETAEIWFVKNGFLYEVTTLKPLAEWLSGVMQTWEFL